MQYLYVPRMSVIRRVGMLVMALGLLAAPGTVAAQETDQSFAGLVGGWGRHGAGLTVYDDGSAEAVWRIYRWCGPGVPQPCDRITDNRIFSGGHAALVFSGVDEAGVLQGEVNSTSDAELLDIGPVTLTPQPYGMALLEQGATQLMLCGTRFLELAPPEVVDQYPCGA
jgi:hypothetical protein